MATDTVRVLDPDTQQLITIPARELAPGMIQVQQVGDSEPYWVAAEDLKAEAETRHPPLTDLRPLFDWFSTLFASVRPLTPQEWEYGFRCDMNYANEVLIWVHVAEVFEHFTAGRNLPPDKQKDIFDVALACANAGPARALFVVNPLTLSQKRAEQIVTRFCTAIDPDVKEMRERYNRWRPSHAGEIPMGELNDELAAILRRYIARRLSGPTTDRVSE
jgi:hypothetical protein